MTLGVGLVSSMRYRSEGGVVWAEIDDFVELLKLDCVLC